MDTERDSGKVRVMRKIAIALTLLAGCDDAGGSGETGSVESSGTFTPIASSDGGPGSTSAQAADLEVYTECVTMDDCEQPEQPSNDYVQCVSRTCVLVRYGAIDEPVGEPSTKCQGDSGWSGTSLPAQAKDHGVMCALLAVEGVDGYVCPDGMTLAENDLVRYGSAETTRTTTRTCWWTTTVISGDFCNVFYSPNEQSMQCEGRPFDCANQRDDPTKTAASVCVPGSG